MTTQEKIKYFKKALRYFSWWNKIFGKIYWNSLCNYFKHKQSLSYGDQCILESEWVKYRTTKKDKAFHFNNSKERRKALRQVIKDLKQQL